MTTSFGMEFDKTTDGDLGRLLTRTAASDLLSATGALTEWVEAAKRGDEAATVRLRRWENALGFGFRPNGVTWLEASARALPSVTEASVGVVLDTITYCSNDRTANDTSFEQTTRALLAHMDRTGPSYAVVTALKSVPHEAAIPTLLNLLANDDLASTSLKALRAQDPYVLSTALREFREQGGTVIEREQRAFEILCEEIDEISPPEGKPVGAEAMLRAAESTNVDVVRRGLREGFDPNSDVSRGSTRLLHYAVETALANKTRAALELVSILVEGGADVHAAITRDYRDDANDAEPRFAKKDTPATLVADACEIAEAHASPAQNTTSFFGDLFEALRVTRETARPTKKRTRTKAN